MGGNFFIYSLYSASRLIVIYGSLILVIVYFGDCFFTGGGAGLIYGALPGLAEGIGMASRD